jgi:hypothetical protein
MVYSCTYTPKIPLLGKFWRALGVKNIGFFIAILLPFGIFYGNLVHFMAKWYILWHFGVLYGDLVNFVVI